MTFLKKTKMSHYQTHGMPITDGKLTCPICKESKAANNWERHVKLCQVKEEKACVITDCVETSEEHYTTAHAYPKCPICFEEFSMLRCWKEHVKSCQKLRDERGYLTCPFLDCDSLFMVNKTLYAHIQSVHSGLHCDVHPELVFINYTELQDHLIRCGGQMPYTCEVCEMEFTTAVRMKEHFCCHGKMLTPTAFLDELRNTPFLSTPASTKLKTDLFFMSRLYIDEHSTNFKCDGMYEPLAFRFLPLRSEIQTKASVLDPYRELLPAFLHKIGGAKLWFLLVYDTMCCNERMKIAFPESLNPPNSLISEYGQICKDPTWIKGHCLNMFKLIDNMKNNRKMMYSSRSLNTSVLRDLKDLEKTVRFAERKSSKRCKKVMLHEQILPIREEDDINGQDFAALYNEQKGTYPMQSFEVFLIEAVFLYLHDFLPLHQTFQRDFSLIRGCVGHEEDDEESSVAISCNSSDNWESSETENDDVSESSDTTTTEAEGECSDEENADFPPPTLDQVEKLGLNVQTTVVKPPPDELTQRLMAMQELSERHERIRKFEEIRLAGELRKMGHSLKFESDDLLMQFLNAVIDGKKRKVAVKHEHVKTYSAGSDEKALDVFRSSKRVRVL